MFALNEGYHRCARKRFIVFVLTYAIALVIFYVRTEKQTLQDLSLVAVDSEIHGCCSTSRTLQSQLQNIPVEGKEYEYAPSADVHSIVHNPKEASVIVKFNSNRTCMQPQLIGRLSGLSLSRIEWNYDNRQNQSENNSVVVGHYNVPSRGTYFLEIIVTMCQRLTMDTDFKNLCLVNPMYHRLTHENATIDVVVIRKESTDIGVWYNMNHIRDNSSIVPLYTRFQPLGCMRNKALDRCRKHTEVARYEPYKFLFETQLSSFNSRNDKKGTLCFVGASHAGVLNHFATKMGADVRHIRVNYVANFTRDAADDSSDCSKIVIGTGQWDAGVGPPTSFRDFKMRLIRAMLEFVIPLREANKSVYFRNLQ